MPREQLGYELRGAGCPARPQIIDPAPESTIELPRQARDEFIEEGRRLVRVFYGLTTFSPLGRGDSDERAIKSIYKAAGWDLADERFLQIQGLLAAMPMTLADGLGADMERLKRFKTVLSTTAANMAPMQGEYARRLRPLSQHLIKLCSFEHRERLERVADRGAKLHG